MKKIHKLHKYAALLGGVVLFILAATGFFLNHDYWNFLYKIRFSTYPQSIQNYDNRLIQSYIITQDGSTLIGGMRGVWRCSSQKECKKIFDGVVMKLQEVDGDIFLATTDGVYKNFQPYILQGMVVTSLGADGKKIVAVVDKSMLYIYGKDTKTLLKKSKVKIEKTFLQHDISLSRFIRDLHYGRGIFDGDISLYINDYGALTLAFLVVSGYLIWYFILKKKGRTAKWWIGLHSNILAVVAVFPLFVLLITGIVLDHSGFFNGILKKTTLPHSILPPVYDTLQSDIWDVDIEGDVVRISNRYGVYASSDLSTWKEESKGFGYKLIRLDEKHLFVSGMGAANRYKDADDNYHVLAGTPHMFKGVVKSQDTLWFFSPHANNSLFVLPQYDDVTLYSILLSMHDGVFFSNWWIWMNDIASILLLIVLVTGVVKYLYIKRKRV